MTILGRGDLAPRRRHRRRKAPYVVAAAVVALAAAGGWYGWRTWRDQPTVKAEPQVVCTTPTPSASPAATKAVKITVLNGTTIAGLAHTVSGQLTLRGFAIVKVGNGKPLDGPSRVTYAPGEVGLALTVAEQVPGATLYELSNQRPGVVQLSIGTGFHRLATPKEVSAARARDLAATAPSPAVCSTPHG